jgi:tetratricopeptide (TPR) repeat protein
MISSSCPYTQDFFADASNNVRCTPSVSAKIDAPASTAFDESLDDPYLTPKSSFANTTRRKQRSALSASPFPSKLGEFLDKAFDEYVARSLHKNSVHTPSTAEETVSSHASLSITSFPESEDLLSGDIPHSRVDVSDIGKYDAFDRVDQYKKELFHKPSSPFVLTNLGVALMNVEDYFSAVGALAEAAQFWRKRRKPVALARVLDRQGACLAALNMRKVALECFSEAFSLRYKHLGPWHIDTIDSRKSMGNAYFALGCVSEARKCLLEVFRIQRAIFQTCHLSVAISAHDLANVMATEGLFDEAKKFFRIAWNTYSRLKFPPTNAAVEQLLNDIDHLTSLVRSSRRATFKRY